MSACQITIKAALSYYDTVNEADSKTLLILLHLRKIAQQAGCDFSITSEMRNIRNQELASVAKVNDFVISSYITGLMMVQLSQNRNLDEVFEDLLDEEGSEICLKPVVDIVEMGKPVALFSVVRALIGKRSIFIGYKRFTDKSGNYEIVLNPGKENTVVFGEKDMLIVIARSQDVEDEQ